MESRRKMRAVGSGAKATGRTPDGGETTSSEPQGAERPPVSPAEVGPLLDALQKAADHEFLVAERLDAKVRQVLTVAGLFFTIVQTVTFTAYRSDRIGGNERWWLIVLAIVALGLLGMAALASLRHQRPIAVGELPLEGVQDELTRAYKYGDTAYPARLAGFYLTMAGTRRRGNEDRYRRYRATTFLAGLAILAAGGEFILALAARLS